MNEILKITTKLTVTCIAAALVMGTVFTLTSTAKKHNERENERQTMLGLLGYGRGNKPPQNLGFHSIHRYVVEDGERLLLGYLVPVRKDAGKGEALEMLLVTPEGEFEDRLEVPLDAESAEDPAARDKAVGRVLGPPKRFSWSDTAVVATLGSGRTAYLLPGRFRGFKTFIRVMLALDPSFNIVGLDIMEHEEDPGLGAEIGREYFKNQFEGKSCETLKGIGVVKEPLPEEYRKALETGKWAAANITREEAEALRNKYRDKDIYAITGATISSRSVTVGVRDMVKKFSARIRGLDGVIASRNIPVTF